jgi:hypothetical protein
MTFGTAEDNAFSDLKDLFLPGEAWDGKRSKQAGMNTGSPQYFMDRTFGFEGKFFIEADQE